MIYGVIVASIIAYILILSIYRKKYVQEQMAFLCVFLIGLTFVGELDLLLPIYFVVSLTPFLHKIRKISKKTLLIGIYFIIYILYGVLFQDINGTLVTFISKLWQFVIFFIVYDSEICVKDTDYKSTIKWLLLFETIIGVYLLVTSTHMSTSGLVRLVFNAQPITGNISTATLPLSVYYYYKNRKNPEAAKWIITINLIMLVWIVLPGTRGYTLEFAATMFFVIFDYFTHNTGRTSATNRVITFIGITLCSVVLVIVIPEILERASSILRLRTSVGIRTYENAAIIDYIKSAPFLNKMIGLGLGGGTPDSHALQSALLKQIGLGMWNRSHYLYGKGAMFHNLYANILMCFGILGILVILRLNIIIWRRIRVSCGAQKGLCLVLHLFQLSFLLMNYYRWSADCGICEMIILALVLKLISAQKDSMSWDSIVMKDVNPIQNEEIRIREKD